MIAQGTHRYLMNANDSAKAMILQSCSVQPPIQAYIALCWIQIKYSDPRPRKALRKQ